MHCVHVTAKARRIFPYIFLLNNSTILEVLLIALQDLFDNKAPFHVKQSNQSSKDAYSFFHQVDSPNMETLNHVKRGEQKSCIVPSKFAIPCSRLFRISYPEQCLFAG